MQMRIDVADLESKWQRDGSIVTVCAVCGVKFKFGECPLMLWRGPGGAEMLALHFKCAEPRITHPPNPNEGSLAE